MNKLRIVKTNQLFDLKESRYPSASSVEFTIANTTEDAVKAAFKDNEANLTELQEVGEDGTVFIEFFDYCKLKKFSSTFEDGSNGTTEEFYTVVLYQNLLEEKVANLQASSREQSKALGELKEIVTPTVDTDAMTLDELKEYQVCEVGKVCSDFIQNGIDFDGNHYRLTIVDQMNIKTYYDECKANPRKIVSYHPDKGICQVFTADQMVALGNAAVEFVNYNLTLCNHLNMWIRRSTTKEEVLAIKWGSILPEDLQTHMTELLQTLKDNESELAASETDTTTETPVDTEPVVE